jgi:phage protein D
LIFAEALVSLEEFDDDIDGEYLAKSVTHTFAAQGGYRTAVSLETEGASEPAAEE